ncbi:MAG: hypothetical protein E7174_05370 [Firmicutes bacterium]|nr:hypothetical protein [Bacillota bacterium]
MENEEKNNFEKIFQILVNYDEDCRKNQNKKYGIKIQQYQLFYFMNYIFLKLINLFPEKKCDRSTEDKYIAKYYIKYKENIYLLRYDNNFSFKLVENINEKKNVINYEDIIFKIHEVYIENEISKIEKSLRKLLKEGLKKEEIYDQIKNIINKEEEKQRQKVKTHQK